MYFPYISFLVPFFFVKSWLGLHMVNIVQGQNKKRNNKLTEKQKTKHNPGITRDQKRLGTVATL